MKWNIKRDIFPLLMIVVFIIICWYFYGILPDRIPSHFNSKGMPDAYSTKTTVIAIGVISSIMLYLILTFIPMIDPFWKKIEKKYNIFLFFRDIVIGFIVFILTVDFISAKGGEFRSDLMGIGFGILFILLGNYMPKLPRNFFFGIRSPWTIASETVWNKTHRIGGLLFVAAGIIIIILILLKVQLFITIMVVLIPVAAYTSLIYPYFLYKKLQKEGKLENPDL